MLFKEDVLAAINEGRMVEAFGSGTAAIVSPAHNIHFEGSDYAIPCGSSSSDGGGAGPLAAQMVKAITDIQYGRHVPPDHQQWNVPVRPTN